MSTRFEKQFAKAQELAKTGSLVVPPPQSDKLWLPPVKEPEPDLGLRWDIAHYVAASYDNSMPPFRERRKTT